jgi:hypothetical protein
VLEARVLVRDEMCGPGTWPARPPLLRHLASDGPASISRLATSSGAMTQGVTKHFRSSRRRSIIEGRRDGREHVWAINPSRLAECRSCLDAVTRGWDDALLRLQRQIKGVATADWRLISRLNLTCVPPSR